MRTMAFFGNRPLRLLLLVHTTALVMILLVVLGSSAKAGTCVISFDNYPRWAAAHGRTDPAAFCRSFAARYHNGTCRAIRHNWSRAQCDDYRRRETIYVKRILPGFASWSVIWRR